jgi:hypothetical protein
MPSYDDDLPTQEEEILLKQLVKNNDERIQAIIEVKNLIIGSKRCKIAFYRVGIVEIYFNLLKEYSLLKSNDILIEIIDCLSSFVKSNNKNIIDHLIELGCIEYLFNLLITRIDSIHLCQSIFRCLRSFFLPKLTNFSKIDYSNPFLTPIPFVLLCDQDNHKPLSLITQTQKFPQSISNEQHSPSNILFTNPQLLDVLIRLLSNSIFAQLTIVEIFCCLCINNERQQQLVEKDIIPAIMHLLVQNIYDNKKINLVR